MRSKHPPPMRAGARSRGGARAVHWLALASASALAAGCALGQPPAAPTPEGRAPVPVPSRPPELQREFRGIWIATVGNLDWPSRSGLSADEQKRELIALLDRAAQLHLNAIVFQVRPAADALYRSAVEPWSPVLTGTMGRAPDGDFDPLALAIAEAHARGMELHAWFNPYRAGFRNGSWSASPDHITRTHPEMVRTYGSYYWLDPGDPAVRAYTIRVITDVVRRYDVDGVHLDDYFYPYQEKDASGAVIPFPDDETYGAYQMAGGALARADWRRENVNTLIRQLYAAVHLTKPWVQFGISPFGIYRDGQPAPGLDAYATLYADSKKWLNSGWVDYFAPQLYWLSDSRQAYAPMLAWWVSENAHARHVWPGNFTSRVGSTAGWTVDELLRQIELTRQQKGATGNIHFSARILRGAGGVAEALGTAAYSELALVPASPWLGPREPAAPAVDLYDLGTSARIRITRGDATPVRFWTVRCYDGTRWFSDVIDGAATSYRLPEGLERPFYVVVNGISRTGVEGATMSVRTP